MSAFDTPKCSPSACSLVRERSSSRSMKRSRDRGESRERASTRASCQRAGTSVMVTWRTMWRSHGAMSTPRAAAACSTPLWSSTSTSRWRWRTGPSLSPCASGAVCPWRSPHGMMWRNTAARGRRKCLASASTFARVAAHAHASMRMRERAPSALSADEALTLSPVSPGHGPGCRRPRSRGPTSAQGSGHNRALLYAKGFLTGRRQVS
jgi:hypothetical protein